MARRTSWKYASRNPTWFLDRGRRILRRTICSSQFAIRSQLVAGNWKLIMCRNIKPLFNFEPPATDDEVRASALQFVRKVSGYNKPSKLNEDAFNSAVDEVTEAARRLIESLVTTSPPRDREEVAAKARERAALRYGH